jgi:cytoskeletal protein CcmA (bactofilin family)
MPADIGRISGIMLKDNLLRDGVDLSFETDLIYLDVNTSRVGIKKNNPDTELDVSGTHRTTNLIADTVSNGNITIDFSRITTVLGSLNITAVNRVEATAIATDDIFINNNIIATTSSILLDQLDGGPALGNQDFFLDLGIASTTVFDDVIDLGDATLSETASNTNLEIRPNGSGTLEVYNEFNITGSLHATGDITLDGTITFGSNSDDSVDFNADVNSNVLPNINNLYKLGGSSTSRWNGLYTSLVNGQSVTTSSLSTPSGVNYALRPGKIWFVATNGDNDNQGNHENGPFATIEKALSVATAGDSVQIYPGTYYELFPLVVPVGVTVRGTDLRSVIIVPDTASQSEDAFHLNGETTVADLTIKDFYYDSINDTGYAFRFAPGITVTTRSPYVQNITVLTHGSTTTTADPRGFASADAGKGALVDGSVANYLSREASMLFHSVTFITPGVDALTMTSGVRVEWLNSFTYFANRGLYATQGTGRLTEDGSTLAYGAEVRSIGSANVYGNYGAVADGADTLMYLIQHNFAYIGVGKDVSNDRTLVIQANETVELNTGKIYYQSQDHTGTFRVGDIFYVDFEQGTVSFDASGLASTGATGLTVTTGTDVTVINKDFITTGNLKIAGNTIESTAGAVNILAANGITNLTLDVNVSKNLDVTGDFSLGGELILGNQSVDTVTFAQSLNQNFEPDVTETYNLGSTSKVWRDVYASEANVNDIRIRGNVIETTASNSDLELRANSAGIVHVIDSSAFDQNLTVGGLTTAQSVNFTGTLNHLGAVILSGDKTVNGNMSVSGTITVGSSAYFDNINIVNNRLFTTDSNSSLELSAAGTGIVTVPTKNVSLGQSLSADGDITTTNVTVANRVTAEEFFNGDILIKDNYITTTTSNSNLELRGNSSGGIFLETTKFTSNIISNVDDIVLQPNTGKNLKIDATSAVILPKGTTADRLIFQTGDLRFNTSTNIFEGYGAAFGGVYSLDRQTFVVAGSTENLNFTANNILSMDITATRIRMNGLLVDNTLFDTNTVITTNNDLTFLPGGTGLNKIENITFDGSNIQNDLNATITLAGTGAGYVKITGTNGVVIPYGDNSQRPVTAELGETRYNVQEEYVEIWDGTQWISAAGVGETVTAEYMEDTSYLWNLILG